MLCGTTSCIYGRSIAAADCHLLTGPQAQKAEQESGQPQLPTVLNEFPGLQVESKGILRPPSDQAASLPSAEWWAQQEPFFAFGLNQIQ
jgi:hypothetical protein